MGAKPRQGDEERGCNRRKGNVQVNVKFNLQQATKTQRGSRGIALIFL
jgi:hypothetical protein